MAKVVKYCAKCEEGFAERFGFCPNCGLELQAFEMNPLKAETAAIAEPTAEFSAEAVEAKTPVAVVAPQAVETKSIVEEPFAVPATMAFSANEVSDSKFEAETDEIAEERESAKPFAPAVTAAAAVTAGSNGNGYVYQPKAVSENGNAAYNFSDNTANQSLTDDDDFRVTVIEEKNVKQRNGLLLGFSAFALVFVSALMLWSLFSSSLFVGPLDEPTLFAFVPGVDEPTTIEQEDPPKKNKDEGGGGGGGGKENPEPVTKGRLPNQVEKPLNPPMIVPQLTNPEFVVRNETQGNIKREKTNEVVGLPNGLTSDNYSSGSGRGGGIGNGDGTGVGNGRGTGEGNGIGSGSGNGNGNGNGDGNGDGDNIPTIAKKVPPPVGVTQNIRILSQPKPPYTDAARKNNVSGTVTLKVVFTASGTIGSVTAVSGLPNGLTEQAIAAAKQIRFEPKKVNGVPQTVSKTVTYTFTIY